MNHAPLAPSTTPVPAPPDPELVVVTDPVNTGSPLWPDFLPFGQDMPWVWHLVILVCTVLLVGEAIRLARRRYARTDVQQDWDEPTEALEIAPDSVAARARHDVDRAAQNLGTPTAVSRALLAPLEPESDPDVYDDWADWVEVALENSRSEHTDDRGVPSYETYGLHPDTGPESDTDPVREDAAVIRLDERRAARS